MITRTDWSTYHFPGQVLWDWGPKNVFSSDNKFDIFSLAKPHYWLLYQLFIILYNEKLTKIETWSKSKKIAEETFGLWKTWKISSMWYVRKLRKESEKRLERLGI
jgi:hypothetical protein